MYGETNMETYITICKINSQWEFAVWLRKLRQGLCVNLEEWDGERDGREVQKGGDICIPHQNFLSIKFHSRKIGTLILGNCYEAVFLWYLPRMLVQLSNTWDPQVLRLDFSQEKKDSPHHMALLP